VRRRIDAALRALETGTRFGEVAERFSEAASKGDSGMEGWRYRGEFRNSALGRAVFETPKGEYSRPVASILGVHIIRPDDAIRLGPPAEHKVRYSQILAKFDELGSAEETLRKIREAVDVTWVHPDYVRYVDPSFLPVIR
jgi:parvulin-like peptidyl-prolyl isomerase